MIAVGNVAHFGRGDIYDPSLSINEPDVSYQGLIGLDVEFRDVPLDSTTALQGDKTARSGEPVVCRLCRNASGVTLYPKRIVIEDPDSPGSITGLAAAADAGKRFMVVDEYAPSAGIAAGALFWCVRTGRTKLRTSSAVSSTSITAGMYIAPATGGYANGSGNIVADGALTTTQIAQIRSARIESRTAYTGSAADADLDAYVHGQP